MGCKVTLQAGTEADRGQPGGRTAAVPWFAWGDGLCDWAITMDEDHPMLKNMTTAVLLSLSALGAAAPAFAEDAPASPLTLSGNINLVSDYRFRGVSLNEKKPAVQGGFDLAYAFNDALSLYLGNWNSSLDKITGFGDLEIDLYGGVKGTAGAVGYKLGAVAYLYPDSKNVNYIELNAEASGGLGPVSLTGGVFIAPSQKNFGSKTGVYIYTTAAYTVPDTGFALKGSVGYEDNAYFKNKLDWSAGAFYTYDKFTVGVQYVDTNRFATGFSPDGRDLAKAGVVFSIGAAF
jgi:uncharacterized protein (TIGR02001 family)